ncbi:MAG: type II secretion system F family protein [Candidatus Aminicenantes bacterium]|nr:type II secretion system F family protein [Candidatus Aminicenantes bacterium]
MSTFICRVADEAGAVSSRAYPAASPDDCRRHFEAEGFLVLSVRRDWRKLTMSLGGGEKRIKPRDFIMFNQEFTAMIRAGYPVLRCLEAIGGRTKNQGLKHVLGRVENDIRHGKPLSEAFAPFEDRFSKVYTAALMAGEISGTLPETITQFIAYAKTVDRTARRIRSAMTYPTLIICFSIVLLFILLNFVLPNFQEFYADFETDLPYLTSQLIAFSAFARRNIVVWPLLIAAGIFLFWKMRRTPSWRRRWDEWKFKVPAAKPLIVESSVSLFSRTLSLLLGAGASLVESIGLAAQAIPNKFLVSRMDPVPSGIRNGEALSDALGKAGFFPAMALDLIRIGETSANLGGMLRELADVTEERIQQKLDTLVSLVEPVVIILTGVLVAGMLLSVYLPMFRIIQVAR